MKIGLLIKSLDRGGAETLLLEHLAESRRHGRHQYSVAFCDSNRSEMVDPIEQLGVEVVGLGVPEHRLPLSRQFWHWARTVDVVHVHSPLVASVARVLSALPFSGIGPVVYTEHGMWDLYHSLTRWANRLTYSLASEKFAVSERVLRSMDARAQAQSQVLHHGVEPIASVEGRSREELRASIGIGPREVAFVTVANCRPEKRLELLVDLAFLAEDHACSFWHIGGGELSGQLKRHVVDSGSPLNLLGPLDNVREMLPAFDVFVLTSEYEGLPVALMEALSAGLPVVSTDSGGVTELVEHDRSGLIAPVDDLEALRYSCRQILDESQRLRLAKGVAAVQPQVDRSSFVRVLEDRYEQVVMR